MMNSGKFTASIIVVLLGVTTGGCGPRLSEEELGRVVDRVPDVPGTEKPYEKPQLGLGNGQAGGSKAAEPSAGHKHSHLDGPHEH